MSEQLIAYLKTQLAPKEVILLDYQTAVNEVEKIKASLAVAEEKVKAFGNIAKIEAEVSELHGFINSLTVKEEIPAAPVVSNIIADTAEVKAAPVIAATAEIKAEAPTVTASDCAKPVSAAPINQIII